MFGFLGLPSNVAGQVVTVTASSVAIGDLAVSNGLLERAAVVNPILAADYPTPAQRPSYSLLDCTETREVLGLRARHWRSALDRVMADVDS